MYITKQLQESVNLPIVMYNIPPATGAALAPATVGKLADIKNIAGVKDSSGNFNNILQYIDATKEKILRYFPGMTP